MPILFIVMLVILVLEYMLLYGYVRVPVLDELIDAPALELEHVAMSALEFEICSDASSTDSGWLTKATTVLPSSTATKVWLSLSEEPKLGDTLCIIGRFSANSGSDWGVSNRAQGISGSVQVIRVLKTRQAEGIYGILVSIRQRVIEQIQPNQTPEQALIAGVLCGYKTSITSEGIQDIFQKTGLSHLIAVSGSHLVVVACLCEAVLNKVSCTRRFSYVVLSVLTLLYVMLCGAPLSALRAWIMFVTARSAPFFSRRNSALSAVGIAGLVICCSDPFCATDLGFQLSLLSVSALSLFGSYVRSFLQQVLRFGALEIGIVRLPYQVQTFVQKGLDSMFESLSATIVCQIATLCLCAVTFGSVSLIAPIANIVVTPLFGILTIFGFLFCVISFIPGIGAISLAFLTIVSHTCIGATWLLAQIPCAAISVSWPAWTVCVPILLGFVLYIFWPEVKRLQARLFCIALSIITMLWFVFTSVLVPAQACILDVGQGDAILIRSGPTSVLVDTGPSGSLIEALSRNNVHWLDAVVLTHLHDDHTGGLKELVGNIDVGKIFVSEGVAAQLSPELQACSETLTGTKPDELKVGDTLRLGSFLATCLWPQAEVSGQENEDSLCLLVSYTSVFTQSFKLLLTGDAEEGVLEVVAPLAGDIDALKVGHHGSEISITSAEAEILKPEVSIASAGAHNSYGHPTQTCKDILMGVGSEFLCTIDHGDITLMPCFNSILVSCGR